MPTLSYSSRFIIVCGHSVTIGIDEVVYAADVVLNVLVLCEIQIGILTYICLPLRGLQRILIRLQKTLVQFLVAALVRHALDILGKEPPLGVEEHLA